MGHELNAGLLFSPIGRHIRLQIISDFLYGLVDSYYIDFEGLQVQHIERKPTLKVAYM